MGRYGMAQFSAVQWRGRGHALLEELFITIVLGNVRT